MPTIKRQDKSSKKKPVNDISSELYGSSFWKDMRLTKLQEQPLCEECLIQGRTTLAEEVHHVRPWKQGQTETDQRRLFSDYFNLMSLCHSCHMKIHGKTARPKIDIKKYLE